MEPYVVEVVIPAWSHKMYDWIIDFPIELNDWVICQSVQGPVLGYVKHRRKESKYATKKVLCSLADRQDLWANSTLKRR